MRVEKKKETHEKCSVPQSFKENGNNPRPDYFSWAEKVEAI